MKIGLLVNPVAGMGGRVGLKGTDGDDTLQRALALGAEKVAPVKAVEALTRLAGRRLEVQFMTCEGEMGAEELTSAGIPHEVVFRPASPSTRADTKAAAEGFARAGVALLIFAGGDGTARDILEAVDGSVPMLGIPCGVKMHSAVFANTPGDVADLVESFVRTGAVRSADVMDIDEEAFRLGEVRAKLFGEAKVPDHPRMQAGKQVYHSGTAEDEVEEIGRYLSDSFEKGVLYILGPGSTTAGIAGAMGLKKTLLGVDAYLDGKPVALDANERTLLGLLDRNRECRMVVTPIGAQGFVLGRGNQQISPLVIRKAGPKNLVIVATPTKLAGTPRLRVDTGDPALDAELRGPAKVITGYKRRKLVDIE